MVENDALDTAEDEERGVPYLLRKERRISSLFPSSPEGHGFG